MEINSPKSVMREAFHNHLITDDIGWLKILHDRNATSHIYEEAEAAEIFHRIASSHIQLFDNLLEQFRRIADYEK